MQIRPPANRTVLSRGISRHSKLLRLYKWGGVLVVMSGLLSAANALEVVVDNTDAAQVTVTGSWPTSTATAGYHGTNYAHDGNTGKGTKSFTFKPSVPEAGSYQVYLRWTSGTGRASNVPVDINYS